MVIKSINNLSIMGTGKYQAEVHYKGYGTADCVCGLKIKHLPRDRYTVILTELNRNHGTSVTNMYEHLASDIKERILYHVPFDKIIWIEKYEYSDTKGTDETWDLVTLQWNGAIYHTPKWRFIHRRRV